MPRLSYASVEDAFLELANASQLRIAVESARRYVSEGIRVPSCFFPLEHLAGWHMLGMPHAGAFHVYVIEISLGSRI